MFKKVLAIIFGAGLLWQPSFASVPIYKHYVIFGDSLTDVGNYSTSSKNCIFFNAPITNHTKGVGGQYDNTTWADAGHFKNTLASNNGGTNYAVAGFTTAQILTSVKSYALNHKGDPNTLYIIWAGTNDVLYAVANQWSSDAVNEAVVDGINNIKLSMSVLYDIGARNFLIIGLLDLSKTPLASYPHMEKSLLIGLYPTTEDKSKFERISSRWNNFLLSRKSFLEDFKMNHDGAHIYTWSPNNLLVDIIKNPVKYGYPAQLSFNTEGDDHHNASYPTPQITFCGNKANTADQNPDHYVFYNFIHPTPYTYNIIAHHIVNDAIELL